MRMLHPQGQPSHINISRGLASLGRAGDNNLVHMSNNEIAGLQKLAMATGGSLTRNPQTGLLEASWLENILPLVAGAALSATGVGAPAAALMVGAADTALTHGDWKSGLAAGLGAFGGAGVASGLAGAGASAATDAGTSSVVNAAGTAADTAVPGSAAIGAGSDAATSVAGAPVDAGGSAIPGAASHLASAAPVPIDTSVAMPTDIGPAPGATGVQSIAQTDQAGLAANSTGQNFSNMGKGLGTLGSTPGATASEIYGNTGKLGLAGLVAPAAYSMYSQPVLPSAATPFNYYTTTYNQGKPNPRYGLAGQSPLSGQGYGPSTQESYTPITYKKGGRVKHFLSGGLSGPMNPTGGLVDTQNTGLSTLPLPPSNQGPQSGIAPPKPLPPSAPPPAPPPPTAQNAYLTNLNNQVTGKTPAPTQPKTPPPPISSTVSKNGNGVVYNPKTGTYTYPTPGIYSKANNDEIFGSPTNPQYTDMQTGVTTTGNFDYNGGQPYARGGQVGGLGSFSDGGQMLKGPGDGMSDDIPAHINGQQPAALADSEFVVPADVVSHLGNGSSSAGAKKLYDMLDRVRKARTGKISQGKQINANRYMPG